MGEWGGGGAGRVHFVRVDVEAEPGLGAIFGVGRVPALLYYEGGAPWELWSGESGGLREWVEGHLARGGAGALHFRTTT